VADPWQYSYLVTGEKKIGKTSWAIEGCEELVIQIDKPQISKPIREVMVKDWPHSIRVVDSIEELAARKGRSGFPYQRIVVDGAGEWYAMCQTAVCRHFGIGHPQDEGYARAWHKLRDDFTDAVNRLHRLQDAVGCGLVFIAHAEWKEKKTREGGKVERLVPNLASRCEEILNGKCDAWFTWDYYGSHRIMVVQGDETTGAGHRIDAQFWTTDGRRVQEIYMGESPKEAMERFTTAFNNEQGYATFREWRDREKGGAGPRRAVRRRRPEA
jgi:hypothetical protein